MKPKHLQLISWGVSGVALALAIISWGQGIRWQFDAISTYRLFPLFGLIAFSLMWSHYIASALRQFLRADSAVLRQYFEVTSMGVLASILLHPGLLIWQLWRDGLGLPPGSTKLYVGSALFIWILVGLLALVLFLAYEFRRWFGSRPWWKYIQYMSDVAMVLIFFHALKLGSDLGPGWFRGVWYFYGLSYLGALIYGYLPKPQTETKQ